MYFYFSHSYISFDYSTWYNFLGPTLHIHFLFNIKIIGELIFGLNKLWLKDYLI